MPNLLEYLTKSVDASRGFLKRKRSLLLIVPTLLLSGCFGKSSDKLKLVTTKTVYKKVEIVCPDSPTSKPVNLQDVVLVVAEDEQGIKVIGISPDDYEAMSKNTQEMFRFIKEQKKVIEYYKKCIKDFNSDPSVPEQ